MKKIFLLIFITMLVGQAWAYDFKSGSLYYNITGYRTVEVTYQYYFDTRNYSGLTNISIPSTVSNNGVTYSVTGIGKKTFAYCYDLRTVTIPNTITSIGEYAFNHCRSITSVTIPHFVTYVGYDAFNGCSATINCYAKSKPSNWANSWNQGNKGVVVWGYAYANSFSLFAKDYVESRLNEWQKKGEFEKVADWQKRVTVETRNAKIKELTQKAEKEYIEKYQDKNLKFELGSYDAENEVFMVYNQKYGNLLVPVPIANAQQFKQQWSSIKISQKCFIENDKISIAEIIFTMSNGKQFKYSNQASLNYEIAQIDYNFEPIDLNLQTSPNTAPQKGKQTITTTQRAVGTSDIDVNIPVSNTKQNNTFAVIIANENYQKEAQVPFAANDGRSFANYCKKTLGIPDNNVHIVTNATLNNIKYEINWLKKVIEAYGGNARVIFYYAGHGIPDESQKTAYLLPVDGYGSDVSTGYKLDDLYSTLGNLPSKSVTVFLDACFSGANRNGEMLASARGIAIKAKSSAPVGNMVVFSAAQGDETAYPNNEQQHGMFTYYLLKKIKETAGNVTYKELGDYVTDNVRKQSIVVNGKSQTPTVVPSATVGGTWETWKLK